MQKKKTMVACLLALAALLGFGAVYAYLTYQKSLMNRFTVGVNEITVTEDYNPPDEIIPGKETEFKKAVNARNTGNTPCYIRVRLEYSDSDMMQYCENILNDHSAPAGDWGDFIEEYSEGNWVYGTDGYYYYTKKVEPGESTSYLMETVRVNAPIDAPEELNDFEIYVYMESIQTLVNREDGNGGQTAEEASGYEEAWEQFLTQEGRKQT